MSFPDPQPSEDGNEEKKNPSKIGFRQRDDKIDKASLCYLLEKLTVWTPKYQIKLQGQKKAPLEF